MSQSYTKVWIHAIWSTKYREPIILTKYERQIHDHMASQFIELGCPVRIINGVSDHVHCLFLLSPLRSVADVVRQVKGSSSHFINQSDLSPVKFSWQKGYACFSVNESGMNRVFQYIKNQKAHHAKKTFKEEFDQFLKLHDLDSEK